MPRNYWATLKKREPQLLTVCQQLKMFSTDQRKRLTDCANTEGVLRIVMSVPSPKAEPLKLWLAQVGRERLQETERGIKVVSSDNFLNLDSDKNQTDELPE